MTKLLFVSSVPASLAVADLALVSRTNSNVVGVPMKPEGNHSHWAEAGRARTLRLVGATAAFLAALGMTNLVLWFVIRASRS